MEKRPVHRCLSFHLDGQAPDSMAGCTITSVDPGTGFCTHLGTVAGIPLDKDVGSLLGPVLPTGRQQGDA